MTYQDFLTQKHFNQEELIAFAYGTLVDDPPADFDARLPAPPFLMIDRVLSFVSDGKRGSIIAEQDVRMDAWYFQCHMPGDPVHPGCLCVDAIWQLLGFYGVWRGALGPAGHWDAARFLSTGRSALIIAASAMRLQLRGLPT